MYEHMISLITVLLPIIGAGIGYLVRLQFEKKEKLQEKVNIERREIYQKFINIIVTLADEKKYNSNIKVELNDFCKKYILYASPKVVISISDFISLLNHENKEQISSSYISKLSKIIFEMRKDLGLSNKDIADNGEKLFILLIEK